MLKLLFNKFNLVNIMKEKNTILFVDDDKACHVIIDLSISSSTPYKLLAAYSCAEAIDMYEQNEQRINLIVSDILLPDMTGYELFDRLKERLAINHVPFIFQSGLPDQTEIFKQRIGNNPLVQILYKPFNRSDLFNTIEKAIAREYTL